MYAPGAGRPSNGPPRLVLMPILRDGAQSLNICATTRSATGHSRIRVKQFELWQGAGCPTFQFGVLQEIGPCAKIARPESDPCPGQLNKPIKSWRNSGGTALPDVPTTTRCSSSNCTGFTAAITIYASSARSAVSAGNFGAAMIQIGTCSVGGPRTKFNA